jgi:hypothetical protein
VGSMGDRDLSVLHAVMERRGGFGHSEHLELAWNFLTAYPFDTARRRMSSAIRHVATVHGAGDRYHDTITRAWVHLVAVHMSGGTQPSFDEFIAENPGLLDRRLLARHYSAEVLRSDAARKHWIEPNLRNFPALV